MMIILDIVQMLATGIAIIAAAMLRAPVIASSAIVATSQDSTPPSVANGTQLK